MSDSRAVEESVKHSIRKNGFPDKQVQLPFKPVYKSCKKNGTSLSEVLKNLREEGIFGIIKGDHILFMPFEKMETAEPRAADPMDLSWMNPSADADGVKNFIQGNLFNINPAKLAELRKAAENLSEEDKQNFFKMLSQLSPTRK